jgi:hypothetical protein
MNVEIPPRGTKEYEWWHQGATAEAEARKGTPRSDEGWKVLEYVDALTEHHHERTGVDIGVSLVSVFSAPHTLRARIKLTRRIWRTLR